MTVVEQIGSDRVHVEPVEVELRRFPYPYKAMLAICSDLDETTSLQAYLETMRFLNSAETTPLGPGAALEVGNSMYFDMPPGRFSYWNASTSGRERIRTLIRSGHVDCLHSYGDSATKRHFALRALEELDAHRCRLSVWVDHARAVTNFGSDIMGGHGDLPGDPAYHADATIAHGVRFVWRGRVTSIFGQDTQPGLKGLWTARHPIASSRSAAKEIAKGILARHGSRKYSMHADNRLLRKVRLRDGRAVTEFIRCNPHWGGVSSGETARGIAQILTRAALDRLVQRRAACVLYTHLGKCARGRSTLPPGAIAACHLLGEAYRAGEILVATTSRLLGYVELRGRLRLSAVRTGRTLRICVHTFGRDEGLSNERGAEDLSGLTLYVPKNLQYRLTVNGVPVAGIRVNPPDETHRPSVSVPWRRLQLPQL